MQSLDQQSNKLSQTKYINIFKECVISVKPALNLAVLKTIKGMGASICSFIDKLNLTELMGATYGDDTVMLIFPSTTLAAGAVATITELMM